MTPLSAVQKIFDYVSRLSVVGFVIILAFAVLALPDQTREIYAVYAQALQDRYVARAGEGADSQIVRQCAFGLISIFLLCLVIWASALRLLHIARTTETPDSPPLRRHMAAAVVAALLPVLALYAGFHSVAGIAVAGDATDGSTSLAAEIWLLRLAAAGLVGAVALVLLIVHLVWRKRLTPILASLFSIRSFIFVCLLLIATTAAVQFKLQSVPVALGALTIISLFLMFLCYVLTVFTSIRRETGIALTPVIVVYGFALSWIGWNDNHRVDVSITADPAKARMIGKETAKPESAAFLQWFRDRADREHFAQARKPYPVFIVSAEGGGLYAGYNTASFLATMQDECRHFSQHVFAVSSVSGGSLGAAVFSALAHEHAENGPIAPCAPRQGAGPFRSFVDKYFETDFLSPLVAATLFPDFIQRLWPWPVQRLDRAKALEGSFEAAWDRAATSLSVSAGSDTAPLENPFREGLNRLGGGTSAAPYLMLHATSVSIGSRITMGGLEVEASAPTNHLSQAVLGGCRSGANLDLKLSSAVSLSARFPWLTPVGWIERPDEIETAAGCTAPNALAESSERYGRRIYLADGGIFENSGLEAALELRQRLRVIVASRDFQREFSGSRGAVEFHIIAISALDDSFTQWFDQDGFALSQSGYGEVASPLVALMSTRTARSRIVENAEVFGEEIPENTIRNFNCKVPHRWLPFKGYYHRVAIDTADYVLPLGWYLSEITRKNIGEPKAFWPAFSRCQIRRQLSLAAPPDPARPWEPCFGEARATDAAVRVQRHWPPFKPSSMCPADGATP